MQDALFPPKRIGTKPAALEERRFALEAYLRHLLTLASDAPGSPLHRAAGKPQLLALLPFFCDDVIDMAATGSLFIDEDDAAA